MMDTFIDIIYINYVDTIEIYIDGDFYNIEINPFKDETGRDDIEPFINGQEVDVSAFRTFYQSLVGLSIDSPIEGFEPSGEPEITVTYTDIHGDVRRTAYYYYNESFLAVEQHGSVNYVISRRRLQRMSDALEQVTDGAETVVP
jgi:hypothetical protein